MYEALIRELVDEAREDEEIVGVLLTGSLARGDALPGTDIDLVYILSDGCARPRSSATQDGVLVERGYTDEVSASAGLQTHPMHVYGYLDGRILADPHGALARLTECARHRFETYEPSMEEKANIARLLGYSRDKIRVALGGADLLKAAFVTGTSSWQIMEGLWAANDRPMPPNSSVQPHLGDLTLGPPDVEHRYRRLFLGETRERVRIALELIDWITDHL